LKTKFWKEDFHYAQEANGSPETVGFSASGIFKNVIKIQQSYVGNRFNRMVMVNCWSEPMSA